MKILGIDPGLRKTGFGIIEILNNKPKYVVSGIITPDTNLSLDKRLTVIASSLQELINQYNPNLASIEKVFVNTNPSSTLLLGQARGSAMVACGLMNIEVVEFTALQIKKTVVGYGHAEKTQVSKMIKYLLSLDKEPSFDASDALAIALSAFYNLNAINRK